MWNRSTISKQRSKLPVNITFMLWLGNKDEHEAEHPVILFQNDYDDEVHPASTLMMTIELQPVILARPNDINLAPADVERLRTWAGKNNELLRSFWRFELCVDELIDKLFE